MSGFATLPRGTVLISQTLLLTFGGSLTFLSGTCGTGSTKMPSTTPPVRAPAQPNFPAIPPEQITWPYQNPAQSSLSTPSAKDATSRRWPVGNGAAILRGIWASGTDLRGWRRNSSVYDDCECDFALDGWPIDTIRHWPLVTGLPWRLQHAVFQSGGRRKQREPFFLRPVFMVDNPNALQALEFDINQTFGGNRWVWGSECNFNGSGKCAVWSDAPQTA